jgi:hypothetical protein
MYLNILGIVNEKVPYLLQYWMKLFPLNLALKCEVFLNSHMKCQTGPHQAKLL